jgi:Domain of unknown function (DUF4175)
MREFVKKINDLQLKQNIVIALRYILIAVSVFIACFGIFYAIFSGSGNHVRELFVFALSLKVFLFLIFLYLALQANRALKTKLQIARQLDEYNLDKADIYQNAFELQSQEIEPGILELILKKADAKAERQIIKTELKLLDPIWKIAITLLLSIVIIFVINPNHFKTAKQFFALRSMPQVQHKDYVELIPGDLSVTRNSKILIEVLNPELEVEHTLFYRMEENWRQEKLIDHKKVFNNLDFSFTYFVQTPYAISDTFRIEVYELPIVRTMDVRYEFPVYTGLKSEVVRKNQGNLKAVKGTKVTLNITANNPIESAEIYFKSGSFNPMRRTGKSSFKAEFIIAQNDSYHFKLIDILGNFSQKISKSITAIRDEYPEVKIAYPGRDTILTQNMLLPLQIIASDDFGMKKLQLHFQMNRSEEDSLAIQKSIPGKSLDLEHIFDLGEMSLLPGDKVTYWVSIVDNSPAAQRTESRHYVARFPSIEEIYREIEEKEEEKAKILQETLEKSEELQKEFEEKRRELLKKEEVDWEDKKDLESILDKQQDLNKDIENVAEDFQQMMEKFEDNRALSSETLEKMERIRELMEEISNEDLQKAMEKMQESLESLDPDVLKKAMEDFKFSMEDFTKKLEQTLQLLEDIKKEQAIQKALEIAEEMEEMQSALNEKTEQGDASNEDLASQQKDIAEKMDSLQKQLEEAESMLDEKDSELQKAMDELQEQMEQDSLAQDMEQSEQSLMQGDKQKAKKSQQSASQKMEQMKQKLEQMQSMMSSGSMMQMGEAIQKAIRRLLIFSQLHEQSKKSYLKDPFAILADQIADFEGINLTLQDLYSTPMIFLALGAKFVYDANFTSSSYREMFSYINDAKVPEVKNYLSDIQKGINLMIYDLMQASNNMQQGGGGSSGMQSLMQSLQQMGQQQMAMNMITQSMMKQLGQNGQMSQEMRGQAQRLAADEERLAENLKRILQNDREAQKQTSALNKIIEDLESISHDLKRGRITQDLVDKQERILSRLLDAQKSIHKREFSKKRKSELSDIEDWDLPEEIKLKFDKMRRKALLNEDFESYSKEYQELIREYLRLLNEKAE